MMTRGRPVSGPASWLLREIRRWAADGRFAILGGGAGCLGQGPGPDLVEARTAIDRSIIPRRERHDGLTPTGPADRGMEFARALGGAGPLGDRPARRAALGVVGQPLAGKEGLLASREAELLGTIATGQAAVLVHPLQTLLRSGRHDARGPRHRCGNGSAARMLSGVRARSARARSPELIARNIPATSSAIPDPFRSREPFDRRVRSGRMSVRVRRSALAPTAPPGRRIPGTPAFGRPLRRP